MTSQVVEKNAVIMLILIQPFLRVVQLNYVDHLYPAFNNYHKNQKKF